MPRILIVDDEDQLRELLAFQFRRRKYDVEEARNGQEALDILKSKPIDAILSDVRMPVMDGMELVKASRALVNPPPILLFSGYSDLTDEIVLKLGAEGLVTKPFDLPTLLSAVEKMLALK